MLKDIKYSGINTESNGYDATAGKLAVAHNVVNDRGYLEPIKQPLLDISYDQHSLSGYNCLFRHEMLSGIVNYIFYKPNGDFTDDFTEDFDISDKASLVFLSANAEGETQAQEMTWKEDSPVRDSITTEGNLYQITAIGNTLCVLTAVGMDYFVFKNGIYKELGTELPFVQLQFGLQSKRGTEISQIFVRDAYHNGDVGETVAQRENVKEGVDRAITLVRAGASKNGRFVEPFLVRYAVRLFDGTYIHHSSPVLMQPHGEYGFPIFYQKLGTDTISVNPVWKESELFVKNLRYADLSEWGDIIDGVDIFVSQPILFKDYGNIVDYNKGNIFDAETFESDQGAYALCKFVDEILPTDVEHEDTSTDYYGHVSFRDMWPYIEYGPLGDVISFFEFGDSGNNPDAVSLFYNIQSLSLNQIKENGSDEVRIDIPANKLVNLAVQPTLTDDYRTHDVLLPKSAYIYNQRINLYDIKRSSKGKMMPGTMLPMWTHGSNENSAVIYITLNDELGEHVLEPLLIQEGFYEEVISNIKYLYVPYSKATKAEIFVYSEASESGEDKKVSFDLKGHSLLNGAVFFDDWNNAPVSDITDEPETGPAIYAENNKIYTSEVGNPFYFPVGGINTVGVGRILALAANVRAISQGQFGEYPLYVFTDSGIWMLSVDDKGLYKAKQPMSLDRILPGAKVTSVDDSVAYVTERGLMLVSGGDTRCISDVLNGKYIPMPAILGGQAPEVNWETFKEGISTVYDSDNRRLHVYNPNYLWHYVYSVRTGEWTTMSDMAYLRDTINGCYVNTQLGLLDFNGEAPDTAQVQTILTRPISFETDAYKRMRDNIQRGDLDGLRTAGKSVAVLAQGSNDLLTWHDISAVAGHYRMIRKSGTPYKWFRWKIVINSMPRDYKLHGLTADVEVTGNNKLR